MIDPQFAPVVIRPATPADIEGLTRIYLESSIFHAELEPERYAVPSSEQIRLRYQKALTPPEGSKQTVLLAELDGEIIGFVEAMLSHSTDLMHQNITFSHTIEIAVASQHRGRKVGASLLKASEDWGCSMGAQIASLEYNARNQRAALFYESADYRPVSIFAIKNL